MSRRYRVAGTPDGWPDTLPFRVGWEGHDTDYGVGDEFDRDFTVEEERDAIAAGLIELVPARYLVVGDSTVFDTAKGDEFEAALLIEQEAALVQGGHIQRAEPKPAQKRRKEKT